MKLTKYILGAVMIGSLSACSIDEVYKTELDQDAVYSTPAGYNGLVNACYENIYYLYGKLDGNAMMEQGDIWQNGSNTGGTWGECVNNRGWSTEAGVNRVVWNALYSIVAYCNTAIYYKDHCETYDPSLITAKAAEAYFLRGYAYFHIVEQWGGVTLTTTSMAEEGAREYAYRNTEEEIYDQIISDLTYAYENLPETQGTERGRANKYTAAAMLTKAWLQRSRLERDFKENPDGKAWASTITNESSVKYTAKQCAQEAFKYAEIVINQSPYKLYASDDTSSGSTKEWDGENNKNNQEFIFVEAIDEANFQNPETNNRGRTRQYYMMNISSAAANFGIATDGLRYGRANATAVHPTLYLLQECFDPRPGIKDVANTTYVDDKTRETTPDTRFDDSFYYKYYIASASYPLALGTLVDYGKDEAYFKAVESRRTINGNIKTGAELKAAYPGMNFYADKGGIIDDQIFEMEDKPAALGCYTPNFPIDGKWASQKKFLVAGLPSKDGSIKTSNTLVAADGTETTTDFCYFAADGSQASNSYYRSLSPSLKKLSPVKYIYGNQYCLNDFPIIRLTDIYLLAAEATVISGENQSKGLEYLNAVRRHAALQKDASRIEVGMDALNIDFLAKERARELCGENWRWYDLKRMGLLNAEYINGVNPNPYAAPYDKKWYVRPIPQQLLDQIANPKEYGTNGY